MTTEERADLIKDLVVMALFVALVTVIGFGALLGAGILAANGNYQAGIAVFAAGALVDWVALTWGVRWLERWRTPS